MSTIMVADKNLILTCGLLIYECIICARYHVHLSCVSIKFLLAILSKLVCLLNQFFMLAC